MAELPLALPNVTQTVLLTASVVIDWATCMSMAAKCGLKVVKEVVPASVAACADWDRLLAVFTTSMVVK